MPDSRLTQALLDERSEIAEAVLAEFLRRHPEWWLRFGEVARTQGLVDLRHHCGALAGALALGSPASFATHVRWNVDLFRSRGIEPGFLVEVLTLLGDALGPLCAPEEAVALRDLLVAGQAAVPAVPVAAAPAAPVGELRAFTAALLEGQRADALRLASGRVAAGVPLAEVYADLVQAALYDIGQQWQDGRITVAQEHLATAVAQFVLASLYARFAPVPPHRGRLVVTGVRGELHQIGALMIADTLEADGWDVRFLGSNLPHTAILEAVAAHDASVLGISTTLLANVPQAAELVAATQARFGGRVKLLVGGAAFRGAPDVWRAWGDAAHAAGVREVVPVARALAHATG